MTPVEQFRANPACEGQQVGAVSEKVEQSRRCPSRCPLEIYADEQGYILCSGTCVKDFWHRDECELSCGHNPDDSDSETIAVQVPRDGRDSGPGARRDL